MPLQTNKVVLLIVFNVFLMVTGDSFKDDSLLDRVARNGRARVVFTPIRGKRTYPENRDALLRMLEAADALKYYYDQLPYYETQADDPETKVTKKVIFTPKLGRSSDEYEKRGYDNDFTPRLGRQADAVTASDEVYRQDGPPMDGRAKYFSPRLGRTVDLTPRLGRSFNYELYPSKIRLTRSTNETKS